MKLTSFFLLTFAALLVVAELKADIQKVTITWTQGLCVDNCPKNLEVQLRKVPGVSDIQINGLSARADISWKPNMYFSYKAVEAAMSMIGLSINDIRVKVRGSLTHDDVVVWLVSTGDGTRFMLLSPMQTSLTQYSEFYNVESHKLNPDMRDRLLQAELNDAVVTIEGPLFSPERSPPLTLIIEKLQVEVKNPPQPT